MSRNTETLVHIDMDDSQSSAADQLQFQEFTTSSVGVAELDITASAKDQNVMYQNPNGQGTENADENQKAGPSFWAFSYYQQFFDVNTDQVLKRVMYSMVPRPSSSYLDNIIKPKPDIYGPFWVCVTLVFAIAISKNLVGYEHFKLDLASSGSAHWKYDFHAVSYAATGIFSYAWLVPLAVWGVLWWQGGQPTISLLELICVYGYSLAIFIPVSVLWVVQISWLQWLLLLIAAGSSGSVLVLSLLPAARNAGKHLSLPVCLVVLAAHVLLAAAVMLFLFNASSDSDIILPSVAPSGSQPPQHVNSTV